MLVAAIIFGIAVLRQGNGKGNGDKGELVPIRVGWQLAWVPQGQFVQIMKNTDVLRQNGLDAKFDKFNYGGPMIEAALAGQEDVIFLGSGPALTITSKSNDWKIVSRMEDFRTAIIVPPDSPIKNINDLKGKVIALPIGSVCQVLSAIAFQKAGLDPKKDVTMRNVDILEQVNIAQKGSQESWGEIAALASWDPTPAQLEDQGKARVLALLPDLGMVVMSRKFYEAHPEAAKNFLKSLIQSYDYYYNNKEITNNWYLKDAGVNYSAKVMETAGSLERNNKAKNIKEISLVITKEDAAKIQEEINQAFALVILKKQTQVSGITNQTFIEQAESEIESGNFSEAVAKSK